MKNLKILTIVDSFKGSATSIEVENAIQKGIERVSTAFEIIKVPIADGGEGTVDSIVLSRNGEYKHVNVTGPLGSKVEAKYGIIDGKIAVIEMAEASGITLIKEDERDPFKTTTYGTGEVIKDALNHHVEEIYIGIGGSATNDGGVGMAQALGVSFKNKSGIEIGWGAEELTDIDIIDLANIDKRLKNVKITILSDVNNPICGENGASFIYGPQKGASNEDVYILDEKLKHLSNKIRDQLGIDLQRIPGSGAAGGLGGGLISFCNADIKSGLEMILELTKVEER